MTIYALEYEGDIIYIGSTSVEKEGRNGKIIHFTPEEAIHRRVSKGYDRSNITLHKIRKNCKQILLEVTDDYQAERRWINHYGLENLMNKIDGKGVSHEERLKQQRDRYHDVYKKIK
jgi:hypothetical protein